MELQAPLGFRVFDPRRTAGLFKRYVAVSGWVPAAQFGSGTEECHPRRHVARYQWCALSPANFSLISYARGCIVRDRSECPEARASIDGYRGPSMLLEGVVR
jgi:hypothetical protein